MTAAPDRRPEARRGPRQLRRLARIQPRGIARRHRPTGGYRHRSTASTQYQLFENPGSEPGGTDGIRIASWSAACAAWACRKVAPSSPPPAPRAAVGTCATAAGCIGPQATGLPRVYRFQPADAGRGRLRRRPAHPDGARHRQPAPAATARRCAAMASCSRSSSATA